MEAIIRHAFGRRRRRRRRRWWRGRGRRSLDGNPDQDGRGRNPPPQSRHGQGSLLRRRTCIGSTCELARHGRHLGPAGVLAAAQMVGILSLLGLDPGGRHLGERIVVVVVVVIVGPILRVAVEISHDVGDGQFVAGVARPLGWHFSRSLIVSGDAGGGVGSDLCLPGDRPLVDAEPTKPLRSVEPVPIGTTAAGKGRHGNILVIDSGYRPILDSMTPMLGFTHRSQS